VIYDLRQTTTYAYGSKVAYARHVLRLMPLDRAGQRVHAAALDIAPVPASRHDGRDFFGNHLTFVDIREAHETLVIRLAARLTAEAAPVELPSSPCWEDVRESAFASIDMGPSSPVHFLFASRQVSLDPEIRDYARASFPAGRATLDGAVDLMARIKADFAYEIGATTVSTLPSMSFALRRGVCQDFAASACRPPM
jgi:transglutaminase-like putative cysteine protease